MLQQKYNKTVHFWYQMNMILILTFYKIDVINDRVVGRSENLGVPVVIRWE